MTDPWHDDHEDVREENDDNQADDAGAIIEHRKNDSAADNICSACLNNVYSMQMKDEESWLCKRMKYVKLATCVLSLN